MGRRVFGTRMVLSGNVFANPTASSSAPYPQDSKEIYRALAGDEELRRDKQQLHEQLLEQNRDLREVHTKSLNEMEELKRYQGSRFDEFSRGRLVEDRDTIFELTGQNSGFTE